MKKLQNLKYKAFIFDRDGVLNYKPTPPNRYILRPDELILNKSVLEKIRILQSYEKLIGVATNQQCVGKELINMEELNSINEVIIRYLEGKGGIRIPFFICTHLVEDDCLCRKPKPGLLEANLEFLKVDRSKAVFIGDTATDREAAENFKIDFIDVSEFTDYC